nr:alanine racemase [Amycolatopsis umgeniensis]
MLVFDGDRLRSNAERVRSAFGRHFSDVRVCYALKACYTPEVVRTLLDAGVGIEVMSDLELQLAQAHGADGSVLCSNGIGRGDAYNRRTAAAAPFLTVVDSESDVDGLERFATAERPLEVAVRVSPAASGSVYFDAAGSKLGSDAGDGSFSRVLRRCLASDRLKVVGLHAHQLSHCADRELFAESVRGLAEVATRVEREHSIRLDVIDIGGGWETRFLFERAGADLDEFARVAAEELSRLGHDITLVVEPGRWLVADAATALCTVTGIKENSGRRWVIVDVGAELLIPLPELVYPPVPVKLGPRPWLEYAVADRTCDAQNVLCASAELPAPVIGDRLALLNCGAYTSVFASAWGHPLPTVLFREGGEVTEIFGSAGRAALWSTLHGVDVEQ